MHWNNFDCAKKFTTLCLIALMLILPLRYAAAAAPLPVVESGASLGATILTSIKSAFSAAKDIITSESLVAIKIKEYVLDPLATVAAQAVIRTMTKQILGWINGDNTGFVADLEQEFQDAADAAGGEVLNKIAGADLCSADLSAFLRFSLRTPGLRQRFACTVTGIVQNINNYFDNFANGGWPAFITVSLQPQNNPYGAYFIGLDAKLAAEANARTIRGLKFNTGRGFKGFEVPSPGCVALQNDYANSVARDPGTGEITGIRNKNGSTDSSPQTVNRVRSALEQRCKFITKTPGDLVAEGLKSSVYAGLDSAKLADEINEGIAAVVNALLYKVISASAGGGTGLLNPGRPARDQFELPPAPTARDIPIQNIAAEITDNVFLATSYLEAYNDSIRSSQNELLRLRSEGIARLPADAEATLAAALEQRQTLLAIQRDFLFLKNSIENTEDFGSAAIQAQEVQVLAGRLNDLIARASVTAATRQRPIGDTTRDTQALLSNNRGLLNSDAETLNILIRIIDQTATSTATTTQLSVSDRGRLLEQRAVVEAQRTLLTTALGRTAELQNDLREAASPEVLDQTVRLINRELINVNQNLQRASALVQNVDVLIGAIPAPRRISSTGPAPIESRPDGTGSSGGASESGEGSGEGPGGGGDTGTGGGPEQGG